MDTFSKSNKIRNVKIDFLVQVPNRRKKFEKNCHVNKELYDFRWWFENPVFQFWHVSQHEMFSSLIGYFDFQ